MPRRANEPTSAGHKLGQLIGDWFEEYFVLPLLTQAGATLNLFLDNRFIERPVRGEKIVWEDGEGNSVDYDFVLELNGRTDHRGIPVAFVECAWRRGARHSKDKARDDSGKLLPMRGSYPTARFLGMVVAGDFTEPARELVSSRGIDLFYVSKDKVVQAFRQVGLTVDYPDDAPEAEKARLATAFERRFTTDKHPEVAQRLIDLLGQPAVTSYVDRVRAKLSALPEEIRLILRHESTPIVFRSLDEVSAFLENPSFTMNTPRTTYVYQVTYTDGSEFEETIFTISKLKELHNELRLLCDHMVQLSNT
jgi:hypothetical protein